jgi:hypothetical protein
MILMQAALFLRFSFQFRAADLAFLDVAVCWVLLVASWTVSYPLPAAAYAKSRQRSELHAHLVSNILY